MAFKFAHKFTAAYIQGEHSYSAWEYLHTNPDIKSMRMINYSAGGEIRKLEAQKAATGILHYFESLSFGHEESYDLGQALNNLTKLIEDGVDQAHSLGDVIDAHYKFEDES